MKQVTIGARTYQVRKMPPYPDQLKLMHAALPIYKDVFPFIIRVLGDAALRDAFKAGKPPLDFMLEAMDTIVTSLQALSDDQLDNLVQRSLVAVQVKQGDAGWANLMIGNILAFQDIPLNDLLQLVYQTVEVNLGDFFVDSLGTSQGVIKTG